MAGGSLAPIRAWRLPRRPMVTYVVTVRDVRGLGGDDYRYDLIMRAPRPDFQIKFNAVELSINAGSGKEFAVVAERDRRL